MTPIFPALGKRDAHPPEHPHRQVKLASFLAANLPDPLEVLDWSSPVTSWGLYQNDRVGNCAIVAPANAIRCWTAHAGAQKNLSEEVVLGTYTSVSGWDPSDPSSGPGAVISDVLALWHAQGAGGIGGDVLDAFAEVEYSDDDVALRRALALFGVVIVGLQLPKAVQGAGAWIDVPRAAGDVTPPSIYAGAAGLTGDWAPGSWGGHAVAIVGYDLDGFRVITWGNELRMSKRFAATYLDEAWALVSKDWVLRDGNSPSGLDLPGLLAARAVLAEASP